LVAGAVKIRSRINFEEITTRRKTKTRRNQEIRSGSSYESGKRKENQRK